MRPHDKADRANRDHGIGHAEIAEDGLFREGGNDMADDAEARQDHDIHFRVTEEPEQVLVQDQIAAIGRIKEGRAEVTIGQQHGDRTGQNRQRQQQQESRHQHRPRKQRHFVQGHARRAHVQNGGDEVDRTENRRRTGEMQRQNTEIKRRAGMARGRERGIDRPAAAKAV